MLLARKGQILGSANLMSPFWEEYFGAFPSQTEAETEEGSAGE